MLFKHSMTLAVALSILEFTSAAASVPVTGHSSSLTKRHHNISNNIEARHELDERGLVGNILADVFGGVQSRCPSTFVCNGSGNDGYTHDIYGNGPPTGCDANNWRYYGVAAGWLPIPGFVPSATWIAPSWFSGSCSKAKWWVAPSSWKHPVGFPIPSFWLNAGFHSWTWPSLSFQCSGKGNDGLSIDCYGNGLPSGYPSGWLWFGQSLGWHPPSGWTCADNFKLPIAWYSKCSLATWWKPAPTFQIPSGIQAPGFWSWPSASFQCSGLGHDGLSIDYQGNGLPSGYPTGWKWFGVSVGWAPPAGWTCADNFKLPTVWYSKCSLATWWKPAPTFQIPSGVAVPSTWWPSESFQCSNKGTDGLTIDCYGNGLPTGYPAGWLWFGVTVGWAPPLGWTCADTLVLPTAWYSKCALATWWSPAPTFHIPAGVSVPSFWSWPSATWTCDKTGKDGLSYDHQGKTCPYAGLNWKYFGVGYGWMPPFGWTAPTGWTPQSDCTCSEQVAACPWWKLSPVTSATKMITATKPTATPTQAPTTTICTSVFSAPATTVTITQTITVSPPKPTSPSLPAAGWKCDGTGKDGWSVDHKGNSCPYGDIGFFWFGVDFGWQPSASFSCSASWEPPVEWGSTCGLSVSWWTPPAQWVAPYWFPVPQVWKKTLHPSPHFTCAETGTDGWTHDHKGNACPSTLPSGFLWFGAEYGWQPSASFQFSAGATVPTTWNCKKASWWTPSVTIVLQDSEPPYLRVFQTSFESDSDFASEFQTTSARLLGLEDTLWDRGLTLPTKLRTSGFDDLFRTHTLSS
ncbi:hypothetical protein P7C70_g4071, partial [Phenoliferia sp. Uapishka_3]